MWKSSLNVQKHSLYLAVDTQVAISYLSLMFKLTKQKVPSTAVINQSVNPDSDIQTEKLQVS